MSFTKLDYCQYLLSNPINYTLTNLAEHLEGVSHDRVNRYLRQEKLIPRLLWENVKDQVRSFATCNPPNERFSQGALIAPLKNY